MLVFCAVFPILLALVLMTGFKVSPGKALPCSLLASAISAYFFWKMQFVDIVSYSLLGAVKALDIILIIYCAIFLLNMLRRTGALEGIKATFGEISPDRRIQVIVIAWFFSNFIEGVAGFGAAPALVAPLLVGMGFPAVTAVSVALICNTVPVPFGGAGIAFMTSCTAVANDVVNQGMDPAQFNREAMDLFTTFSCISGSFVPLIAVSAMILLSDTKRKIRSILEIAPLCFAAGILYVVVWKGAAMVLGPELPSVVGSLLAYPLFYLILKIRLFVPKRAWDFSENAENKLPVPDAGKQTMPLWKAWLPYLCIAALLVISRVPYLPVRRWLGSICQIRITEIFSTPGTMHQWSVLTNPGIFPFLPVGIIFALILGLKWKEIFQVARESEKQIRFSAFAIFAAFAMVQIMVSSSCNEAELPGMLALLTEKIINSTGKAYLLIAPVVGCFGTFFAGSCTVSNILFCPIQFNAAGLLDFPEAQMIALQNTGGGIGSMLRLSGIVATCATVNICGKEGKIILLNLLPALILLVLTLLGAYCYNLWFA
ncbi:MAG: L-lactate permease [Lentisphaerae bacterium]|nr:L-lactate permease [Lentisphaerota bacterium]